MLLFNGFRRDNNEKNKEDFEEINDQELLENYTLEEIAKKMGKSTSTISKYLKGGN